jgi:peroxiredoxin
MRFDTIVLAGVRTRGTNAHGRYKMETQTVSVGDPAPDFTVPSTGHGDVSLSGLRGKKVVIAFYPRDDTPG